MINKKKKMIYYNFLNYILYKNFHVIKLCKKKKKKKKKVFISQKIK